MEKSHEKPKNREDCLKRGLSQLADLIGSLSKKKEWCFWAGGSDFPIHTMDIKSRSLKLRDTETISMQLQQFFLLQSHKTLFPCPYGNRNSWNEISWGF